METNTKNPSPTAVYHPFLLALFPVLFLFAHNIDQSSFSDVPRPALVVLGVTALLFLAFRLIFRDARKAGLITSLLVIMSLSYGHIYSQLIDCRVGGIVLGRHRYMLGACLLLVLAAFRWVRRREKPLDNLTRILNVVSLLLLLISGGNLIFFIFRERQRPAGIGNDWGEVITRSEDPEQLRDIYYIIFDRYAGADALREFYGYDNRDFLDYLAGKGFYVAGRSRANYLNTTQSLSSALNLRYLDDFPARGREDSRNWRVLYPLLEDYEVQRFLKGKGYRYLHFGGLNDTTRNNRFADENFNLTGISDLSLMLYQSSIVPALPGAGRLFSHRRQQWERIRYQFRELTRVAGRPEPTFTLAHFILPHPPFVFERDGSFLPESEADQRGKIENYRNQLIYCNQETRKLIDTILADSPLPPVIIIQGDEGPWPKRYEENCNTFDWREATDAELREKFSILNAYYLPADKDPGFYPSITPVNSFRLVFNALFDTGLPLLPDKSYAVIDAQHPFRLIEVTGKIAGRDGGGLTEPENSLTRAKELSSGD